MATLPARPNLGHLRRQARDVLRAAQAGDITAVDRIQAVSSRLTLATAQLAVAREYGFASWAALKAEVEARTMDLAQQVEAFCTASIRDWTGRAARMLAHGADPDAPGPDGRSPYALATGQGRTEIAAVLRRHGAIDDATSIDRFLSACLRADQADVRRQVTRHPELLGRLTGSQQGEALVQAAEAGHTAAVSLMLDLGFPTDARGGGDGATALHAAAYSGSAGTARLMIDRGADIEAHDTHWDSGPLDWAVVGSGQKPVTNPHPDWIATIRTLIEAGASTQDITLAPDDPKPPSPEVAELLRGYGIGADPEAGASSSGGPT